MTKIQKMWLWVGIGLFAIPEILWSPVANFIYAFFWPTKNGSYQILRDNFLHHYGNDTWWSNLLLMQFIGLLLISIQLLFIRRLFRNSPILYWVGWVLLFLFTLAMFFIYGFSTIRINW